jgi:DNA-binding transcriptional ArsR family regulator
MSDRNATFRALSDPTRRAILETLAKEHASVSELCDLFDVTQPAISQHLAVLRDAGLVRAQKEGRKRIYALDPAPLREVHDWAGHFEKFWNEKLDALSQVLERQTRKKK